MVFSNTLNKIGAEIRLNESWDKELQRLRKNRESFSYWKKEKDKQRKEQLKKRNPGDF